MSVSECETRAGFQVFLKFQTDIICTGRTNQDLTGERLILSYKNQVTCKVLGSNMPKVTDGFEALDFFESLPEDTLP